MLYTTTTIVFQSLQCHSLSMISRCTRKVQHDKLCTDSARRLLSCSTPLVKVDLSPSKCGFVATTRGIALTVCAGRHEKDSGISSTKHARDLGVDVSFGKRSVPIARKRAKRAGIRSGRSRSFAQKHQRACRLLFKGGALKGAFLPSSLSLWHTRCGRCTVFARCTHHAQSWQLSHSLTLPLALTTPWE